MPVFEFKLPDIGEGVTEGEIVEWHVSPGDAVNEDDPMVEVMTDKATVTIGAPKTGVIRELKCDVGAVAQVGSVIVVIDAEGTATGVRAPSAPPPAAAAKPEPRAAEAKPQKKESAATAVGDIRETLSASDFFSRRQAARKELLGGNGNGHGAVTTTAFFSDKPLATPATRKLARDLGVDLRHVRPSGDGGRVTKEDVRSFASSGGNGGGALQEVVPSRPAPAPRREPTRIEAPADERSLEERKPFVGIRRRIAERMQMSKNTAAHFTFVEECDVSRLIDVRARLRAPAEAEGVKLSFLPFIVKAVIAALARHPVLNSALDESKNELVYRRAYHIGIAAATDAGLMVPVVRHADRLTLLELAREIDRLGEGARNGKLTTQELTGSTFTITSLGKQGGLFATPILNFPEVGILGVHQMKQKPVVRDGQIVVGDVMLLSLSFDHRIVDGHVGAAFAYDIIALLENPERLLLEMA
jgi:pyruvate dehydrogenase E2 component (dihydrolipoamide acetyltransferase)